MDPLSSSDQDELLKQRYLELLSGGPIIGKDGKILTSCSERIRELRRMIIVNGLPKENQEYSSMDNQDHHVPSVPNLDKCSIRGCIWKLLLGVDDVDAEKYIQLLKYGASMSDEEIRNDTFRTFTSDTEFSMKVPEEKLTRVLNAFVHELGPDSGDNKEPYRYVQGMNILSGPFLYTMPEVDAYYSFCTLITKHCPRYVAPHLEGVHAGCQLVDECLEIVDPMLYEHLYTRGITATIYAFPLVLSLFACSPPLKQLLRVWDVLLAMGIHFIVILCISHIVLLRSNLLSHSTPMELMKILQLREIPELDADALISVAFKLLHRIPDDVIYRVACHPLRETDSGNAPWAMWTQAKCKDVTRPTVKVTASSNLRKNGVKQVNISKRPPWR